MWVLRQQIAPFLKRCFLRWSVRKRSPVRVRSHRHALPRYRKQAKSTVRSADEISGLIIGGMNEETRQAPEVKSVYDGLFVDTALFELLQTLDPISALTSDLNHTPTRDGVSSLSAKVGSGQVKVGVTAQSDLLSLYVFVGEMPATPGNYATLLAHNREGPWWFRIDDAAKGVALVIRVCELHRRETPNLARWMLEGMKEYWTVQPLLEVLNGTFDQP